MSHSPSAMATTAVGTPAGSRRMCRKAYSAVTPTTVRKKKTTERTIPCRFHPELFGRSASPRSSATLGHQLMLAPSACARA